MSSGLKLGMFLTPATVPGRPMSRVIDWNVEVIRRAEQYGYSEIWIGEHITSRWSVIACPQHVIARALADTERIVLGTAVEVLYLQHPLTLAAQLAQLDHMARGRLHFGFGAGATVTDRIMYGIDAPTSHEMVLEGLEIIFDCWSADGPRDFDGKYWTVRRPVDPYSPTNYGWHHRPYAPYEARVAFAGGFGRKSAMLELAGARGAIPMSLNMNAHTVAQHWASVEQGATTAGRRPDRSRWRQVRDIYVADTMEEARRGALNGCMARFWNEYFRPICEKLKAMDLFQPAGSDPGAVVDAEYLIDHGVWFVGDPRYVADRIREQFETTGGFGTLLQLGSDYADESAREGWFRSMELLGTEVLPRLQDLTIPKN